MKADGNRPPATSNSKQTRPHTRPRRRLRARAACLSLCLWWVVGCLLVGCLAAQSADEPYTVPATNLHQWGAVTLFHGLPSDRVRAIAQDADGALWFGTDNGLARYDGRRTQTVQIDGLTNPRVLALKVAADGVLWVGTDGGAARLTNGAARLVEATRDRAVTAIALAPAADGRGWAGRGRVWLATQQGVLFDVRPTPGGALDVRVLPATPLTSADADKPGPLALTSLAYGADGALYIGTRSRGLLRVAPDETMKEVNSRPRPFFVEALAADAAGHIWLGARTRAPDSGLFEVGELVRPGKVGAGLGTVSALTANAQGDVWAGTDGQGVWHYRAGRLVEHFTFEGTAGGLRSDHVYASFTDREGVVWFGTDRGVCRYDGSAPRNEPVGGAADGNFLRALYRTQAGELLAGANRGLFVYDERTRAWRAIEQLARKTVYAFAEDATGRLLVGTAGGLYVGVSTKPSAPGAPESVPTEDDPAPTTGDKPAPTPAPAGPPGGQQVRPAAPTQTPPAQPGGSAAPPAQKPVAAGGAQPGPAAVERPPQAPARRPGEPRLVESVRALRAWQGAIYVASYGRGLERLDGARRTHVWPAADADARLREVTSLHADGAARLWIGTAHAGVFVYENGVVRAAGAALAPFAEGAVWALAGHDEQGLWLATERGLYLYRAGQLLAVVPNVDARAVVPDADGAGAWCATAGAGLLRVRLDAQAGPLISRLDVEQGLASANAFALLPLHTAPLSAAASTAVSAAASPIVAAPDETAATETLLIGTSRGLVRYQPGRVAPTLVAVRVLSRRLHQPEELPAGIALPYPQNSLALDVAALSSRTFPEQFQYAFVLRDGAGRELRRKLARDAQFVMENLAPGRYRVEARAYTRDLVASAPLAFEFTVARAPFPWTTTMLAVLLVFALVGLMWGTIQNRRIARTSVELATAHHELAGARLELANEAERERRRIARDLHDQTLADLRSLMLLTDQLPAGADSPGPLAVEPARFRAEIEAVSQEVRRICEDLSPSALENVGLAAALEWALANVVAHAPPAARFDYEFACADDFDERLALAAGERMQIYRIAQEAINNVCRHAAARHVRLNVALTDAGALVLLLEDDGPGFDPQRAKRGRGLANIRARASLIEADVSWTRRPDGGTRFTLHKAHAAQAAPPLVAHV